MESFKPNKEKLAWGFTAFLVIIACIAFYAIIQHFAGIRAAIASVISILSPFIWGAVMAYLLAPIVKFFQKIAFEPLALRLTKGNAEKSKKLGRGISITVSIILVFFFIASLFYFIIPQLYESIERIVTGISTSMDKVQGWADKWLRDYPLIENNFSGILEDITGSITKWAKDTLLPQMQEIITTVSTGLISVFKTLANIVIAIAASIYILYSNEKFTAQAKKIMYAVFSPGFSKTLLVIVRFTDKAFMSFFSGKILDSAIVGVLCYFGCLIIGIKDPVLIAVIIGITNIIPVFGPFIGAIPSALIILMYSPIKCIIFIAFILVLQQFDGNFLGPKILGGKAGMSGFWILFSITVGAGFFGPVGMIIGFPLFVVLAAGIKTLVNTQLKKRSLPLQTAVYSDLDFIDPETRQPVARSPKEKKPSQSCQKENNRTNPFGKKKNNSSNNDKNAEDK